MKLSNTLPGPSGSDSEMNTSELTNAEKKDKLSKYMKAYRSNPENRAKKLAADRRYHKQNADKINERCRKYRELNKEKIAERDRRYNAENKDAGNKRSREYYKANKESITERQRKNRLGSPLYSSATAKKYYENNREKISKRRRDQYLANRASIIQKSVRYNLNRRKTDPLYDLINRIRSRTSAALRKGGYPKNSKTYQIIGCDWACLFNHIELQFTKGMTWENRKDWHIDHIIPLASAKTEPEIMTLCHYTNLQPLWASENIKKGSKIPVTPQPKHEQPELA